MTRHHEVRHLPYSAEQMFTLVADVGQYEKFIPWIVATRIREDSATAMTADLVVGFKGLRESFTSRVNKHYPDSITVDYVDGPLRHLTNEWHFHDRPQGGCDVDFTVDFAFRNSLFERMVGQVFDRALRKMIGAFEARAATLYASGLYAVGVVDTPGITVSGINNSNANNAA